MNEKPDAELEKRFEQWLREQGGGEYYEARPDDAFYAGWFAAKYEDFRQRKIIGVSQPESDTETHNNPLH